MRFILHAICGVNDKVDKLNVQWSTIERNFESFSSSRKTPARYANRSSYVLIFNENRNSKTAA